MGNIQHIHSISKHEFDTIWGLKSLAMLSVFFAHMPWHDKDSLMYIIYSYLGIIGVPIFLFLSGYLSLQSKKTIGKQVKSIIIPWIIYATMTFMGSVLINHRISCAFTDLLSDYFRWVCGSGSIYYFLSVLLICQLISKYFNEWLLVAVSLVSIGLSWEYIPHNGIFTRYLNPFNFIIYYALGRLVRKLRYTHFNTSKFTGGVKILLSTIVIFCAVMLWKGEPTYFNLLCVPFSMSFLVILYNVLNSFNAPLLINIGKISFVVYLIHIQIVGVINTWMTGHGLEYFKVFCAYAVVCAIVLAYKTIVLSFDKWHLSQFLGFR